MMNDSPHLVMNGSGSFTPASFQGQRVINERQSSVLSSAMILILVPLVSCAIFVYRNDLHSVPTNVSWHIIRNRDFWNSSPKGRLLLGAIDQQQKHEEIQQLICEGANVNVERKEDGSTPLHVACENGDTQLVRLLLKVKDETGLAVDKARKDGMTPLFVASARGHVAVVRLLLEDGGADISKAANKQSGSTALYVATKNGHIKVVRLFLSHGAKVDETCHEDGWTPLFIACQNNHEQVSRILLEHGADFNTLVTGTTPLILASTCGNLGIVRLLLDNGADIDQSRNDGITALYSASQKDQQGVVRLLLSRGSNVNKATMNGWTPLAAAAYRNHHDVCRMLLNKGADSNKVLRDE